MESFGDRIARLLVAALWLAGASCASGSPPAGRAEAPWRGEVVRAASSMVGAPYRYGGRTPDGFDCSGLVAYSYARAGLSRLPRTADGLYRGSERVALDRVRPGDLLFFALGRSRIAHVGIYVGDGEFVHAPKRGRRVERVALSHPYWGRELTAAGRPREPID